MLGIRYKYTTLNNNSTNISNNVNTYYNNGGGSSTLKKKYAAKLNTSSGNKSFSINSSNKQYYVNNPNSMLSIDPFSSNKVAQCLTPDNTTKISVKNYHALRHTRIVNNQVKSNINISHECYKNSNPELVTLAENNKSVNKHFNNPLNRTISMKIYTDKTNCPIDSSLNDINNYSHCDFVSDCNVKYNINSYSDLINKKIKTNNVTKDKNQVPGITPDYQDYYNDANLFNKKNCLHNPPDAKVIAC